MPDLAETAQGVRINNVDYVVLALCLFSMRHAYRAWGLDILLPKANLRGDDMLDCPSIGLFYSTVDLQILNSDIVIQTIKPIYEWSRGKPEFGRGGYVLQVCSIGLRLQGEQDKAFLILFAERIADFSESHHRQAYKAKLSASTQGSKEPGISLSLLGNTIKFK